MDKVSKTLKEQASVNLIQMKLIINRNNLKLARILSIHQIIRKIKMVRLQIKKIGIMRNQEIRAIKKKIKQKIQDII